MYKYLDTCMHIHAQNHGPHIISNKPFIILDILSRKNIEIYLILLRPMIFTATLETLANFLL